MSFVPETGALMLRSVSFTDSGDYLCVVNNKRDNGMARLFVQGEFEASTEHANDSNVSRTMHVNSSVNCYSPTEL